MGRMLGCGRWLGLTLGLALTLGSATLLAQGPAISPSVRIGNKNSKVYHRPACPTLKRTSPKNKVTLASVAEAEDQGYTACKVCHAEQGPSGGNLAVGGGSGGLPNGRIVLSKGPGKGAGSAKKRAADDEGGLTFSKDIAPIFQANCAGCHGGAKPKGEFNLTTFNKMLVGSQSGKVITPGKPDESLMIELLENGKMPQGNNNKLTEAAIAKVRDWVKSGARLDAGINPDDELKKYAPTADDLRREALAKLSPEERDEKAKGVALDRWKKASSKASPEMTSGKNFLVFGNLPPARAEALLKALDGQLANIRGLLGQAAAPALNGTEKISLYVFNEPNAYVEFVRALESRELEPGDEAHGRLDVQTPYLAAVDPLNGADEPEAPKRSKKRDNEPAATRSLAGLLTEQLASAAVASSGKPPRWLSLGVGAYLGSLVEPRAPHLKQLREEALDRFRLNKVTESLGGEGDSAQLKAVGFSLCEWLGNAYRPAFGGFVRGMLAGQGK
ncbi:MAG: c-type cytochrome domain-containing protein, partial [Isosphaeraceae bacterium]